MLVALGLIGIEICAGTDDPTAAIPKSPMGSVLLLPLFCSWGGRGWRWAMQPCRAPTSLPRSFCCGRRGEGLQLGPQKSPRGLQHALPALLPKQRLSLC